MGLSLYASKKALDYLYGEVPVYCGLMDENTTLQGLRSGSFANEITTYDGARKELTIAPAGDDTVRGYVHNGNTISFTTMPQCNLKYAILVDAASGGNIIGWCSMTDIYGTHIKRIVVAGSEVMFPIGKIVFKLG